MNYNAALGVDLDRHTGELVTSWSHVEQCLGDIFTTFFGERVMREWYGSLIPALLGENMTVETITKFFAAVSSAIDQWEPRFKITKITPVFVGRDGKFECKIEGDYRPLALIGNFTSSGAKRVTVNGVVGQGLVLA